MTMVHTYNNDKDIVIIVTVAGSHPFHHPIEWEINSRRAWVGGNLKVLANTHVEKSS